MSGDASLTPAAGMLLRDLADAVERRVP
jgi:hypothetical protein